MSEEKKNSAILEALPWRCFHCDFVTNDPKEAAAHFGDRDYEDADPFCIYWRALSDDQKFQQMKMAALMVNELRRENRGLQIQVEGLEYQVNSAESAMQSYKPFKACRTINDVFCLYDSMEGRALAAEERERELLGQGTEAEGGDRRGILTVKE